MTAPATLNPAALIPRIQDIQAGKPARLAGVPVPLNAPLYTLQVFKDDTYGSTLLLQMTETQTGLPVFELTGAQTASLSTILVATNPCGYDLTNSQATTGWYKIQGQGTDPETTEPTILPSAHGPLVIRLDPGLTRRPAPSYYPPASAQGCGCGGSVLNSLPCGCGGCSSTTPCDHSPIPAPDDCNVLTQRARFEGAEKARSTRWPPTISGTSSPPTAGTTSWSVHSVDPADLRQSGRLSTPHVRLPRMHGSLRPRARASQRRLDTRTRPGTATKVDPRHQHPCPRPPLLRHRRHSPPPPPPPPH